MYLSHLILHNYRNYNREEISLHPEMNLIFGENGQGKTNLLEAIFILSTGKSPRNARDQELVQWGKDWFRLAAKVARQDFSLDIDLKYRSGQGKVLTINGQKEERLTELLGRMAVVLFSPEELQLVKGGPNYRRRFLNLKLSQTNPKYYHCLQQFRRILQQRNILLKELRRGRSYRKEDLPVWDQQLAQVGSILVKKRQQAVEKLTPLARAIHEEISGGREKLDLSYKSTIPGIGEDSIENLTDSFLGALTEARAEDIRRGSTSIGPHRDDILIFLDEYDSRIFASQGQQRTAALSLKLAEMDYIQGELGETPLLLLDDVMSELDADRRNLALEVVQKKGQVFITGTGPQGVSVGGGGKEYWVKKGTIAEV